nr:alpha/beta fold hydrolase [Methylonatrum kenyense]
MLGLNWSRVATPSPELEIVERAPDAGNGLPGLLFVHGAYAGAWCWEEHFLDHFAGQGFHCRAVSLRGHGASGGQTALHDTGLNDYVQDVATVVQGFSKPPVLIGHSMGGMVVQKYLETASVPAAVLLATVPHIGLGHSIARLLLRDPWLLGQMGLMQAGLDRWMDLETASRAVFSPDLPADLRARYAARMQPESRRALAEMGFANLPNRHRMASLPPMLVLAAAEDALFEARTLEQTARYYDADFVTLAGLAHAMMLERDWVRAADALNDWLQRNLQPVT